VWAAADRIATKRKVGAPSSHSCRVSLVVLAWLLIPNVLQAQAGIGGSLIGVVTDSQGGRLPNAIIVATNPSFATRQTTTSDEEGNYHFRQLFPGTYTIAIELNGFAKAIEENVVVGQGTHLRLDVALIVGSINDEISVSGDAPMIDWRTSTQVVNISSELLRRLPMSSTAGWADFLTLVPGIATNQARLQTYFYQGASHASGGFFVDGADATSVLQGSTLYSQFARETFEDVQVKTSSIDASAPLGFGPIVDIVTRTGTNRWRGSFGITFQPKAWNGRNTPGGETLTVAVAQTDFAVGGPVSREQMWFFASGRLARNATGNSRAARQVTILQGLDSGFSPFDNVWRGQFGFAKIDRRLSTRHGVMASYSRDVVTMGGAQPNELERFRNLVAGGPGYFARVSSVWNSSVVSRMSLGYNGKRQVNDNLGSHLTGVNVHDSAFLAGGRLLGTGTIAVKDASPFPGIDFNVYMWTIAADLSYFRQTRLGSHEVNAGVYLQPRRHNKWTTHYNNEGFQLLEVRLKQPGDPRSGVVPFHKQVFDVAEATTLSVNSSDVAAYLQDVWRATSALTLTSGLRVDRVKRVDQIFGVVTQRSIEVAPRLGLVYMLTSDHHNAIRAHWSRVYDNLSINETTAGTNIVGSKDFYDVEGDGSFSTVFLNPARFERTSNLTIDLHGYHQGKIDEVTLGYRRQLPGQTMIDIGVARRAYRDRPAVVETNGIYTKGVFIGYQDETQNEIYRLTANQWNWPVSSSVQLQVTKRSATFQLIAAYTRQWAHLAGTWQPNDPASFLQPDSFPNRHGVGFVSGCTSGPCADSNSFAAIFGGNWRDHVASVGVSRVLQRGIAVATTYSFQTGPWSGPIVMRLDQEDLRGGPATVRLTNDRVVSNPLATSLRFAFPTRADGQLTLTGMHLWNIRVSRTFRRQRHEIETAADLYNVMNTGADQTFQPGANQRFSPFFAQGAARQFPRAVQVSCHVRF